MSATLAALSNNFMYAATAVYALAMLAHAAEWAFARPRARDVGAPRVSLVGARASADLGGPRGDSADSSNGAGSVDVTARGREAERAALFSRIGIALTVVATLILGAGVLTRGLAAERVPWSNLYEFATTGTFLVCVAYLVAARRYRLQWLGLPVTGLALVLVVLAVIVLYTPVAGLIPALRSYWLIIHVSAAVVGTAIFTVGALTSILQLARARVERKTLAGSSTGRLGAYLQQIPTSEAIDRIAYRLHAFAFPVWTFALICGAIWAGEAWGRYWGWDPKEVWMFITWVCYAAYLHAGATAGWRAKMPWIALVGYTTLLFNLIGVNLWLPGLHSYA